MKNKIRSKNFKYLKSVVHLYSLNLFDGYLSFHAKNQTFLEAYNDEEENQNKNPNEATLNDLLIHQYFNYSDQLKPLLMLMDDQTIKYLKTFDDIMYDLVTSLQ